MLHILQFHHLISQQFQCPTLPPIGSLTTGQVNQVGFTLAIQAATFRAFSRETAGEGHFQASLHKPLFDANHGAATDGKGCGNLPIGVAGVTLTEITHE